MIYYTTERLLWYHWAKCASVSYDFLSLLQSLFSEIEIGVEDVESKILAYCNGIIFSVNILPFKNMKRKTRKNSKGLPILSTLWHHSCTKWQLPDVTPKLGYISQMVHKMFSQSSVLESCFHDDRLSYYQSKMMVGFVSPLRYGLDYMFPLEIETWIQTLVYWLELSMVTNKLYTDRWACNFRLYRCAVCIAIINLNLHTDFDQSSSPMYHALAVVNAEIWDQWKFKSEDLFLLMEKNP